MISVLRSRFACFGLIAFATVCSGRAANLVQNGGFDTAGLAAVSPGGTTLSFSAGFDRDADGNVLQIPGWNVTPIDGNHIYNCLVASDAATVGFCGSNPALAGPQFAYVDPGESPDGGNYFAGDGDAIFNAALTQTINGLIIGRSYDIIFYQAGGQQQPFPAPDGTTALWQVCLDAVCQNSDIQRSPSEGGTPWNFQRLTFTAQSSGAVLSFLAIGTPNGVPPFAFLDGVQLDVTGAPEPGSVGLILVGLVGIPLVQRLRAQRSSK